MVGNRFKENACRYLEAGWEAILGSTVKTFHIWLVLRKATRAVICSTLQWAILGKRKCLIWCLLYYTCYWCLSVLSKFMISHFRYISFPEIVDFSRKSDKTRAGKRWRVGWGRSRGRRNNGGCSISVWGLWSCWKGGKEMKVKLPLNNDKNFY